MFITYVSRDAFRLQLFRSISTLGITPRLQSITVFFRWDCDDSKIAYTIAFGRPVGCYLSGSRLLRRYGKGVTEKIVYTPIQDNRLRRLSLTTDTI